MSLHQWLALQPDGPKKTTKKQVLRYIKSHTADKMYEKGLIKLLTLLPSHNGELDMHILPHNGPLLLITLIKVNQAYKQGGSNKAHSENKWS